MLLVPSPPLGRGSRRTGEAKLLRLALLLVTGMAGAEEPRPPCILDVPVYGPFGDRLPFRVTRVTPVGAEGDKSFDLLSTKVDGIIATSNGDRIFFPSDRILGRFIEVTLEGPKSARITTKVALMECRQRRSLFFGQSDLGFDVNGVGIRGRLSGCRFTGDWWVRAVPMFGGPEGAPVTDGYVLSDGSIVLTVGPGVRHLVVVGKGKQPLRVMGVDITVGKLHDIGLVDLSNSCPQ